MRNSSEPSKPGGAVWRMICAQERALVAEVEAIRVSNKPEVIGALFEENFREYLRKITPSALSIVPGFVVDQDGNESSHFDALIVDSAFPFLSSIGPHRYVMSPSVVAAIELTTRLDSRKLTSVIRKARELERISHRLYGRKSQSGIGFFAVALDSTVTVDHIRSKYMTHKPLCDLFTLRPPHRLDRAVHCWMEGIKEATAEARLTESPLADFVSMQLQDCLYSLADRAHEPGYVGAILNDYIHWGTVGFKPPYRPRTPPAR
jgi:hypothetical protein